MALNVKKEQEAVKLRIVKSNLDDYKFQVELFPDVSGSIRGYFGHNGVMEAVLQRSLAFASRVDPDGQVQITPFSDKAAMLGDFASDKFDNILTEFIARSKKVNDLLWQNTDYSKPFKLSNEQRSITVAKVAEAAKGLISGLKNIFGLSKPSAPAPSQVDKLYPRLIIMITDGENFADDDEFYSELMKAVSDDNTFVMMLGVGGGPFDVLEEADKLSKSVDFVRVPRISDLNDDKFYDLMLSPEFVSWIKSRKVN